MGFESAVVILKDSAVSFLGLLPYLFIGLLVGSALEIALSRYKEINWLKKPGTHSYLMVSLVGVGTPL